MFLAALCATAHTQNPSKPETRKAFEMFASELAYFDTGAVSFDRTDHMFRAADREETATHRRQVHGPSKKATIADLANLPCQPHVGRRHL